MESFTKSITVLNVDPGSLIAQRYEVQARIGSGGMGMVFRVVDRELNGEVVALKLLHPHLAQDENVFKRFLNEVLVARTLSHPNIIRIHDIGKAEGGFYYISMEFVDGESLKDQVFSEASPGKPGLPFEESLRILYQILRGVAYAHEKGVLHRDLKPANVIISKKGEVKLADFGTARIMGMDTSLTQTGQTIGTPDYMSPEQIKGEQLDASCDIYALGIIAFELATGTKPFVAESSVAVAFKHLHEPVPMISTPQFGVPEWYQAIVHKAMAKDKADRFASVSEFAAALSDHIPDITKQTMFFSADSVEFASASGSGSRKQIVDSGAGKGGTTSAHPKTEFHLGSKASDASGDRWVFDFSDEDRRKVQPSAESAVSTGKSPFVAFLVSIIIIGALAFGGFKYLESEREKSRLAALDNLNIPEVPLTSVPEVSVPELNQTDTGTKTETTLAAATNEPVAVTPTTLTETKKPKNSEIDTEKKPEKAKSEPVVVAKVAPVTTAQSKEVAGASAIKVPASKPEPYRPDSNSEIVQPSSNPSAATSVPASGIDSPRPTSSDIARQPVEPVRPPVNTEVPVVASATNLPNPPTVSTSQASSQGLMGSAATQGVTQGAAPVADRPAISGLPPARGLNQPPQAPPVVAAGTYPGSVVPGSQVVDPQLLPPPPVAEIREDYVGEIIVDGVSGAEVRHAVTLNLVVAGSNISGSASIDGVGQFSAKGSIFPRGLEIVLNNSQNAVRLTGSKRGQALRGRFVLSPQGDRGAWSATLR